MDDVFLVCEESDDNEERLLISTDERGLFDCWKDVLDSFYTSSGLAFGWLHFGSCDLRIWLLALPPEP